MIPAVGRRGAFFGSLGALAASVAMLPAGARAQGWNYPSFQLPITVRRELNFAVADGGDVDGGTSAILQFRQAPRRAQFALDLGLVNRPGVGRASVAGGVALARALGSRNDPLAVLLTAGAYATVGDPYDLFRVPIGASIGRPLPLEGSLLLTPYVHPRASFDICTDCGPRSALPGDRADDADLNLDVELGLDLAFTPALSIRLAAVVGSDSFAFGDGDAFGVSLAYRPAASAGPPRAR